MAFDERRYQKTVLVPLAKDQGRCAVLTRVIRDVQGAGGPNAVARLDTSELFAIEPDMGPADLVRHLKSLEMAYNKTRGKLLSAKLLEQLLTALGEKNVRDPAFWVRVETARANAVKTELAEFARAVAQEYLLHVITPEQLAELAAGMGLSATTEIDLAAAVAQEGVTVCPDFEIPNVAIDPKIRKVAEFPQFRTIVDVVLRPEQPTEIAIIDELSFGSPVRRLGPQDVADAIRKLKQEEAQVEQSARHAAQYALAELGTFSSVSELHALVLSAIAATVEGLLRRGVPRIAVRAELVDRGVRAIDASRLVAKLAASTKARTFDDVTDLLSRGHMGEARGLVDGLKPRSGETDDEWTRTEANVAAREKRKLELVDAAEESLKRRDYAAAAIALRDALQIDTQDEDLRVKLERLPPPPPAGLSLRVVGRSLEAAWSADGGDSVRYTVVRTTVGVPVNHEDGVVVAKLVESTKLCDDEVPIGTLVRYSVFATRDGSSYSDPTTATSVVLPAPYDFAAAPGTADVSLSWATPPEAAGVVVTQTAPDGTSTQHRPATPGQLAVGGLITGTKYRFSAKAVYLLDGGETRESAAAELDATPRGAIREVDDLCIEASPGGHRARWSPVVGYTIELWALPIVVQLTPGSRMSAAQLTSLAGRRLTLRPASGEGGQTAREFDSLPDVGLVVPVTLDGDGGLVGTPQVAGSAPSVRTPVAERFGDEIRLSWAWPQGDYAVEVGWKAGGEQNTRRVSRTSYNRDGGVRLPVAGLGGEVTLATVVTEGAREWVSAPIVVQVSGTSPVVKYKLSLKRSKLSGKRTATVTVDATEFHNALEILTVLKEAKFMPNCTSDGSVIDRRTVDLSSGGTSFSLDLGKVVTPFWVRVFSSSRAVRLEDPPTSQMRGA